MAVERNSTGGAGLQAVVGHVERVNAIIRFVAHPALTLLLLRFALAVPFWRSGVNKWDGFLQLNEVAVLLFTAEFKLHLPGGPYDFPAPAVIAFITASAEILLPVVLLLGLASRLVATALLVMTIVVQLTVPDGWPLHVTWAAMALAIMSWGPGQFSLDYLINRFTRPS